MAVRGLRTVCGSGITLYPDLIKKPRAHLQRRCGLVRAVCGQRRVGLRAGQARIRERGEGVAPVYASGSAGKNIVSLSTSLGLRHELQCHKRQPDAALAFVTIKLSGHEAPHYAPEPSFARFRASSPATRGERRTAVPTRASRRARLACRLHCAAAYAPDRMSSLLSAKS